MNCDLYDSMCRIKKIEHLCQISNKTYEDDSIRFPPMSQFKSSFDRISKNQNYCDTSDIHDDLPIIERNFYSSQMKLEGEADMKKILFLSKNSAHLAIQQLRMSVEIHEANNVQVHAKNEYSTQFEDLLEEDEMTDLLGNLDDWNLQEIDDQDIEQQEFEYNNDFDDSNVIDNSITEADSEITEQNYKCDHSQENFYEKDEKKISTFSEYNFEMIEVPSRFLKNDNVVCKMDPYTYVFDKYGKKKLVWKSSLVWLFSKGVTRISSDRLSRVQSSTNKRDKYLMRISSEIINVQKVNEIFIGDWCIFLNELNNLEVGYILQFTKKFGDTASKRSWKQIEYAENFVELCEETKNFGVLCQWYTINFYTNCLEHMNVVTHGYTKIFNYFVHIPQPFLQEVMNNVGVKENKLFLKNDTIKQIQQFKNKQKKIIFHSNVCISKYILYS